MTAEVVLEWYLLPEDCEKNREIIESYIFRKLSIDRNQDRSVKKSILRNKYDSKTIEEDVDIAASIFTLDLSDKISIASYKKLMDAIQRPPRKADALRDQIRGRGDLLILPSTKPLGVVGEIAWLRHVWQVPLSGIAIRTSEVGSKEGERIARLDSPYRYRLTQLMAQVFSDIGLPNTPDSIEDAMKKVYSNA